jgi:hypothetical protein
MKARSKRFFKRLLQLAKIPFLVGIGLLIGVSIAEGTRHTQHTVVIQADDSFENGLGDLERRIEERIEQHIEAQIIERIAIPPIPEIPAVPPIPEIPPIPAIPEIPAAPGFHIVERGPSVWDVLSGIGTILASLLLIGLGGMMLLRHWRQPKEKSPKTL